MKRINMKTIPLLAMMTSVAFAQQSNESVNASSSLTITSGGLQIQGLTDTERVEMLLEVALVYYSEGDFKAALEVYERVLKIDPDNKNANFLIGPVYISTGMYGKAETTLKALIKKYPDEFELKNNLAWLYATSEDPAYRNGQQAVKLAQEAMVLAPTDHHIWSTLAEAYYVTGQYDKAYRAIVQMASLASRYGTNITPEMIDDYNEQIRKCQRAMEAQKLLNGEEQEPEAGEAAAGQQDSNPDQ